MTGLFKNKEKQIQRVISVDVGLIIPNKSQPRGIFDEAELLSLSESIRENGIIQPVNVRKCGVNYEIVSGERRFRAAKMCGLTEIPCIVIQADDEKSAVLALLENIQRKDLNYFEEAIAIEKLITYYGLTQEEAAARLGKAQSTIANKLRLLKFTEREREVVLKGNITERQARALIRIDDEAARIKALSDVLMNHLNIHQTELMVENLIKGIPDNQKQLKQKGSRKFLFPVPRLYINSINKIVRTMKEANIDCETIMNHVGDCYEYTIKFHSTTEI